MDNIFHKEENVFPIGGFMPINVPSVFRGIGKKLRDRMYRTILPESYSADNALNFIKGNPRMYRDPNSEALLGKYTAQDSIIADSSQSPEGLPPGRPLIPAEHEAIGDSIMLGGADDLRKYAVSDIIIPSKSKEGAYEFAYPNKKGNVYHLPTNYNDLPESRWNHSKPLGSFHQTKTKDDKGNSISYEDIYDINIFRGKSATDDPSWKWLIDAGKKVGLDKVGNLVPFGKPFEVYGKQYYDKNGKPIKEKAEGGSLQPKDAWDTLSMAEKAEMMKVAVRNGITKLQDIRDKYNEFAEGGGISDEEYYTTMEKVAEENYDKWGMSSPDEALVHALNDNTYNYRGYYDKYPQSEANADTHWTDEFKTVYHPTFSVESSYSGQESQYNPQGLYGGHWIGDKFIPAPWQKAEENKEGAFYPKDYDLNKGVNLNSNVTVGNTARKAGEDAVRENNRRNLELVEMFNSHNEINSLFPIGNVSGEDLYKSVKSPKIIGLSGSDPVGEFYVAGKAFGPLFRGAEALANWGSKYISNVPKIRNNGFPPLGNRVANGNTKTSGSSPNTNVFLAKEQENTIAKYANSERNPLELIDERMSDPLYASTILKNSDPKNSSQEGVTYFENINPMDWESLQEARTNTYDWWGSHEPDVEEGFRRSRRVLSGIFGGEMPFANPPSPFVYMPDKEIFFNLPIFTPNALMDKNKDMLYNIIKAHERAHNISTPNIASPLAHKLKDKEYWGYLNNREVAARGTQIKNYFNKKEITEEELKYAAKHYSEDTGIDNNMSELFGYITEEAKTDPDIWKKMAKWISEVSPIGLITVTTTSNDKK